MLKMGLSLLVTNGIAFGLRIWGFECAAGPGIHHALICGLALSVLLCLLLYSPFARLRAGPRRSATPITYHGPAPANHSNSNLDVSGDWM